VAGSDPIILPVNVILPEVDVDAIGRHLFVVRGATTPIAGSFVDLDAPRWRRGSTTPRRHILVVGRIFFETGTFRRRHRSMIVVVEEWGAKFRLLRIMISTRREKRRGARPAARHGIAAAGGGLLGWMVSRRRVEKIHRARGRIASVVVVGVVSIEGGWAAGIGGG
jgi:hypothetical protein